MYKCFMVHLDPLHFFDIFLSCISDVVHSLIHIMEKGEIGKEHSGVEKNHIWMYMNVMLREKTSRGLFINNYVHQVSTHTVL